ncbi:MAG: hypothetical protein L3J10_10190 [Sulfurimonas sp.]|nr:hypothetical protein [Sulfurimonas sp.]
MIHKKSIEEMKENIGNHFIIDASKVHFDKKIGSGRFADVFSGFVDGISFPVALKVLYYN